MIFFICYQWSFVPRFLANIVDPIIYLPFKIVTIKAPMSSGIHCATIQADLLFVNA